jgi:hypothetical protein
MPKMLNSSARLGWLAGEMLVIVLGVLIALGLDDYQTDRREQALEAEYLGRILSDIEADIAYLEQYIAEQLDKKILALETIAPVVRGQESVPNDLELFLRNVSLGGLLGASSTQWVTDVTFEDMRATGNLRLIRDSELRRNIANYYHLQNRLFQRSHDRRTDYVAYVHTLIPAELRDALNIESMSEFGTDRAVERILSPEFQDLINQEINNAYFLKSLNTPERAHQLSRDINDYLLHPGDATH